jgi:hypothetical protein
MLALLLAVGLLASIYQIKAVEGINVRMVNRVKMTIGIIAIVPLFRACDGFRTATTLSTAPSASIPGKVAFYLFQLIPELVACLICVRTDWRGELDTGGWGDSPRQRIEAGKKPQTRFGAIFKVFLSPWRWPVLFVRGMLTLNRIIRARIKRRNQQDEENSNEYRYNEYEKLTAREVREKLPSTPTASGWQSTNDLASTNSEFSSEYEKGRYIGKEGRLHRPPPLPLVSSAITSSTSSTSHSLNPFRTPKSNLPNSSASSTFGSNQTDSTSTSRLSRLGGSVSTWLFDEKTDENASIDGRNSRTQTSPIDTLVTDVNLWTPRMLQSFSLNKGNDSNV